MPVDADRVGVISEMRYISVCSGIEAATVAWKHLGWKAEAYSEIEPFPCAVLDYHYPNTQNLGDMTKHEEWKIGSIDILAGGTPCQSFSVAGLRQGLADPRGNLMLSFLAIAASRKPRWVVWENVPGVLSSNGGRDFGTFLGALGQLGYGWAYRVLDAQWFGVAQRRKRVFVVGYLGDASRAAKVLFERESVRRNPAPSRKKGEGIAGNVAPSLTASNNPSRSPQSSEITQQIAAITEATWAPSLAACLETTSNDYSRADGFNMVVCASAVDNAPKAVWVPCTENCGDFWCNTHQQHTGDCECPPIDEWKTDPYGLQVEGPAANHPIVLMDQGGSVMSTITDGTVGTLLRETHGHEPIVAFAQNQMGEVRTGEVFNTINTNSNASGRNTPMVAIAFKPGQSASARSIGAQKETACTLEAGGGGNNNQAVAIGTDCYNGAITGDVAATIGTPGSSVNASGPTIMQARQVRRLTPVECERLQGFPDDYTLVPFRKSFAKDGHRYKALGNSMAVPVMRWIGTRISALESDAIKRNPDAIATQ